MPAAKTKKDNTADDNMNKNKTKKLLHKLRHFRGNKQKHGPFPSDIVTTTQQQQQEAPLLSTTRSAVQPQQLFSSKQQQQQQTITLKSSWLSRTKWFTKMSNAAFLVVDADESGQVDEKELYSGLLLIHLKLGCYAGPAACRPVDRERVHAIFVKMDIDHSGTLDQEEFREVMMVLCSNIFTRVLVQWSMTLVIVPLVAQYILNILHYIHTTFWNIVMNLDEYSPVMDKLELVIEHMRDYIASKLPRFVMGTFHVIQLGLNKVPTSVWNTVPLTLISCMLACLAVPYIIFKVDDYFQELAEQKKHHVEET